MFWSRYYSVYNHTPVLLSLTYRVLVTLLFCVQSYYSTFCVLITLLLCVHPFPRPIITDVTCFDDAIALPTIITPVLLSLTHRVWVTILLCVQPYPCLIISNVICFDHSIVLVPRGLTFTWWECRGLCQRHNVKDINQPSFPAPVYSVLVFISVFMALSTVFHSINSSDNSPLSHSVLPVLILPYWSFQLYICL